MEEQGALALALLVGEVNVVEPPRRHDAGLGGALLLLPVEPPEVDALLLKRVVQKVHVVGGVLLVGDVEGNVLPRRGIDAHGPGHGGIGLLPWLHARRRMHIERGLQALLVNLLQEVVGVGKEDFVPGVAGPAEAVIRLVDLAFRLKLLLADVPAHVDDQNVERHIVFVEAADELVELLIGVIPVARPPRAEGKARRQRDAAGDFYEVAECLAVVVAVAEEVPVN